MWERKTSSLQCTSGSLLINLDLKTWQGVVYKYGPIECALLDLGINYGSGIGRFVAEEI